MKHNPFMLKKETYLPNTEVSNVLINVSKAYNACSDVFHEYFKTHFDILLRTELHLKDKYLQYLYDDENLFKLIDDSVRYRLGLNVDEPNATDFIYSMVNPYFDTVSLDKILERIMYSAYPAEVLIKFKNKLDSYISDERIVDLMLSKLENEFA